MELIIYTVLYHWPSMAFSLSSVPDCSQCLFTLFCWLVCISFGETGHGTRVVGTLLYHLKVERSLIYFN